MRKQLFRGAKLTPADENLLERSELIVFVLFNVLLFVVFCFGFFSF